MYAIVFTEEIIKNMQDRKIKLQSQSQASIFTDPSLVLECKELLADISPLCPGPLPPDRVHSY